MAVFTVSFAKIRDFLWPLGATVLALFVVPIAIEQYPEMFKEAPWILPLSIAVVCACWLVPLIVHDRVRTIHGWMLTRLGDRFGWLVVILAIGVFVGIIATGGYKLYGKHKRHLEVRLKGGGTSKPETRQPSQPIISIPPPSTETTNATAPETARVDRKATKLPTTEPRQPPQPLVIQTGPTFGNLADRANALSDQIMEDLYRHGWYQRGRSGQKQFLVQQMPTKPEEVQQWTKSRSSYFRFRFFEAVLDIRNEFAQLHLRDTRLDDFFKYQGLVEQANRQMAAANIGRNIDIPILPQQIEEVAERLKILANQIPAQRAAPRPLHFSVTQMRPEKPEFPFEIVVTIDTDAHIAAGYIVVEFEGARASVATDFAGSKLIMPNDDGIIGNKPLKDYLLSHPFGDIYALEIGKAPFTPRKPIHVIAYGRTRFSVPGVTLFDK